MEGNYQDKDAERFALQNMVGCGGFACGRFASDRFVSGGFTCNGFACGRFACSRFACGGLACGRFERLSVLNVDECRGNILYSVRWQNVSHFALFQENTDANVF